MIMTISSFDYSTPKYVSLCMIYSSIFYFCLLKSPKFVCNVIIKTISNKSYTHLDIKYYLSLIGI